MIQPRFGVTWQRRSKSKPCRATIMKSSRDTSKTWPLWFLAIYKVPRARNENGTRALKQVLGGQGERHLADLRERTF